MALVPISLACCGTPDQSARNDNIARAAAETAINTCEASAADDTDVSFERCVAKIGAPEYSRLQASTFSGDVAADSAGRRAEASVFAASILGAMAAGMAAYGQGYSAAISRPQPVYTPPLSITCQTFGSITRCR